MSRLVFSLIIAFFSYSAWGQQLEILERQDNFIAGFSEAIKIPLKFKNTGNKPIYLTIKRTSSELGAIQKGYFCLDKNCLDPNIDEFSKRLEAGETLQSLVYVVESGIQSGTGNLKFQISQKGSTTESMDYPINFTVQEKTSKQVIFQSRDITIEDVYPNPVQDIAYMHYKLHNENIQAKVVIHNILGRPLNEIELSPFEERAKIQADDLVSGIYFYTLYLDNNGVLTRKLIIRK